MDFPKPMDLFHNGSRIQKELVPPDISSTIGQTVNP